MSFRLPRTPTQKSTPLADAMRLSMLGKGIAHAMIDAGEDSPGLSLLRHKAAVPAMSTAGSALVQLHADEAEFIASMSNTLLGTIAANAVRFSFEMVPVGVTVLGGTGGNHAEGEAKRVTQFGFDAVTLVHCDPYGLIVLAKDFVKIAPLAIPVIAREMRNVVGFESDKAAIPVLTAGIPPLNPTGYGPDDFARDVATLLVQIRGGAGSVYVLGMNSALLKRVSMLTTPDGELAFTTLTVDGGELQGITVVPTDALEEDSGGSSMILVDAAQIGFADGPVEIRNAQHASIQLDNAPDSPPSASTVATSMFQQGLVASLAERHFGIARLRDTAVAWMQGCNYGAS